jgi:4-amino-4-deoxy-L-arabinose transferase-like glycosyltransferase
VVLSSACIIGFWLRIHNLGSLGLIVDEGHQALAVNGILKHGYPLVPSGVAYLSVPVYQYFQYFAALLFGLNEFSLRLPGVLFNLASIPMIYLFARSLFNAKVGLLSAFLFTFSVWEIEVSRYARVYSAFQFLYIMSLFIFYKGFIKGRLPIPGFLFFLVLSPLAATLLLAFACLFYRFVCLFKKWAVLLCESNCWRLFIYIRSLRFLTHCSTPLRRYTRPTGSLIP